MLEKTFRMTFFLKNKKNSVDDVKHIFLRITVNGVTKELSTKIDWPKSRWNSKNSLPNGNKSDAIQVTNYLESVKLKVLQARQKILDTNKELTAENIKRILLGEEEKIPTLMEVFKEHNQKMNMLVGTEYAPGTMERYETSFKHTQDFLQWKYRQKDIELKKLNYEFISDYEYWFRTVRRCSHNTTIKYLTNLKKIVLLAVKKGYLVKDPFINFKLIKREVHREALTEFELEKLISRNFPIHRLNLVKDLFIFSCYTGLAYVDVKNLKPEQIVTGIDGEKWVVTFRQKTDTPTRLPLLPQALEIIEKYRNHPEAENKGRVLPVLSNQKINAYLKEIGDLCHIQKDLTFHIARHTFATTVTLSNGVPIETVSKMLGHKSLSQTQLYAKILDTKISEEMTQLRKKLEGKDSTKGNRKGRKPRF